MFRFIRWTLLAAILGGMLASGASAAGGSCPSSSSYINLSSPASGGGSGSVTLASLGISSCFYISAAGSDSNSGTSESAPWLHAPGMPGCSATCASTTPASGNGFIFRGGDSWHRHSGSPLMGGDWSINQSGTGGSPIYYGVDFNWFSGGAFARPILDQDNPLTTSAPGSCSFPNDGTTLVSVSGANIILDAFEFRGNCMSGSGDSTVVMPGLNQNDVFERNYIHGWSTTTSAGDDGGVKFGNQSNRNEHTARFLFNVIDGADSTYGSSCTSPSCAGSGQATGWAFGDGWDVEHNVIRHVSNGVQAGNISILIGNDFEYLFEPTISGRHGNVVEMNFGSACVNGIFYNNVTGNVNEGINWINNCSNHYYFNNVFFNDQHFAPDPNGILICGPGGGSASVQVFMYNNTLQDVKIGACSTGSNDGAGWSSGSSITFENNQIMDFTSVQGIFVCNSGSSCKINDNGGEVFQTTSAANAQGYTYANRWAPTSNSDATVGKGLQSATFCQAIPNNAAASACQAGTTGAVTEASGWGGLIATYPSSSAVQARLVTGEWDAGAYQFGSSSSSGGGSTAPKAPTGLTATVE